MSLIRSVVLFALIGTTVGASGPANAQPASVVAVRLGVIPSIGAALAYVAQERGYFEKHNLNVELVPMNSGSAIAEAVVGGSLEAGFSDIVSIANARARGLPFEYIAAGILNTPEFSQGGLIVRADSQVQNGKALGGQVVAVNALNSISSLEAQVWIDANGGDSKTVKFIEAPLPQMPVAVANGTVAAAVAGEPIFAMAVARGDLRVVRFTKSGIAPTFMLNGWFADAGWVEKNRAAAAQLAGAIHDAAVWANANRAGTERVLVNELKLPAAIAQSLVAPPFYGNALRAKDLQPIIDVAVKYGAIQKPLHAEDIIARF
jgi:NitT/TauT family transport system substrate-binding protein